MKLRVLLKENQSFDTPPRGKGSKVKDKTLGSTTLLELAC
jgi:hypothetical protein